MERRHFIRLLGGGTLAAVATTTPDTHISTVSRSSSALRSMRPATRAVSRLVTTAKAPEMAMPYPTQPSLTPSVVAIGESRLTGMNSEAIRANTHRLMASTPPQLAG